jgi:ketosteroid isomerase-like protein
MVRAFPLLLLASLAFAASPEQDVKRVLADQQAAWNRGDLDSFAASYLNSPQLVFVSKDKIARGYAGMLERYKTRYSSPQQMGQLTFSALEVTMLGSKYANVLGHFHLERTAAGGGNADGIFTLLFEKTLGGWKIIQDHTS